jgi:hypothetical protein
MCSLKFDDPSVEGFVDSIPKSTRSGFDSHNFGPKKLDSKYFEGLSSNVFLYGGQNPGSLDGQDIRTAPTYMVNFMPNLAQNVAVATPCCPAPVSGNDFRFA